MKRATRMHIRSAPKIGSTGAHRTVTVEQTWDRLRPLIARIGITRLADITGLDRLGIPTYSAVRPTDYRSAVTVTCGKGVRALDAKVGAIMESLEYKLGEPDSTRGLVARMEQLPGNVAHPSEFNVPPWVRNVEDLELEWVEAWDLMRDEAVWIPAATTFIHDPRGDFLFETDTSGLASGNCIAEAICHALAEVIERDADSIAQSHAVKVGRFPQVDPTSIPDSSARLVERFVSNGVDVHIQDFTSDLGVACFNVTCVDRVTDKLLVHGGSGAHLVAEIALNRALTEAAQSRAADIQGSREDLAYFRRVARDPRHLSSSEWRIPDTGQVRFDSVDSVRTDDIADDIRIMIERLKARGFRRVAVVDLSSNEFGMPAVRVVVPGLEISCVDPWRAGARVAPGAERYVKERWSA